MLKYLADGISITKNKKEKIPAAFCVPDDMFLGLQCLVEVSHLIVQLLLLQLWAPDKLILSIQCSSQLLPFLTQYLIREKPYKTLFILKLLMQCIAEAS